MEESIAAQFKRKKKGYFILHSIFRDGLCGLVPPLLWARRRRSDIFLGQPGARLLFLILSLLTLSLAKGEGLDKNRRSHDGSWYLNSCLNLSGPWIIALAFKLNDQNNRLYPLSAATR